MSDDGVLTGVSLRIQSVALTVREISDLLGVEPDGGVDVGSPVSSRNPEGARRTVTTWYRRSAARSDDFDEHLRGLDDVVSALVDVGPQESLDVDLVLMMTAAELGALVDVTALTVWRLAAVGAGIVIDAYNSERPDGD